MKGLLGANFSRLWKTAGFWGCLITPAALCLLMEMLQGGSGFFVSMYNAAPISLFFSAVFSALYIGTDYSDRTLINKLTRGISRVKIYFANLITVSAGMTLIFAAAWAVLIVFDITRGRGLDIGAWNLALYAVLCLAAGAAMAAVCTLVATLITLKPLAAAFAIMMTIGMFIGVPYILGLDYSSDSSLREAVGFVCSLMPTQQISDAQTQVAFMDSSPEIFKLGGAIEPMWYSLGTGASATLAGALAFRKKSVK